MDFHTLDPFIEQCTDAGLSVQREVDGSTLNTYRVGGKLSATITLNSKSDVIELSRVISSTYVGVLNEDNTVTIGRGSNVVIDDDGFHGVVILFAGDLASWSGPVKEDEIEVPAGVALPVLARQCAGYEIGGIEFYVGIPGSVGGAVAMNAGGHGKQTSDVLVSCTVLDLSTGEIATFANEQCDFSYRHSRFTPTDVIFSAVYKVGATSQEEAKATLDSIVQWRRDHQPGGRNVGSVFQNPVGTSAGALIEECGLKDFRMGGAFVSPKHANFIQADENATASDIRNLIHHVRNVVSETTGTLLDTEVRFIGTKNG